MQHRWRKGLLFTMILSVWGMGAAHADSRKPQLDEAARAAIAGIGQMGRLKLKRVPLEQLFANAANEVIVEFQDEAGNARTADRPETRERRGLRKRGLLARLGRDVEGLNDYEALPMSHKRVRGHRALAALLNDPDVKAVYPNERHYEVGAQSLPLINQPYAAGAGYTGQGTTVAVLDSGLDFTRAAFGSCVVPGWPASCRVAAAVDIAFPDFQRDRGTFHGTNVAGIIAAVAPGAKLIGLDVFSGNSALSSDLIKAVNWVIANKTKYNIVAMNLSLGSAAVSAGECVNSWATTPFANARAVGVIPVVASGNAGNKAGVATPACAPGAVSVGAVYDSNGGSLSSSACSDASIVADQVTCFSNTGSNLDFLAPGAGITAAGITMTGTSQAAPHVAGAIAVMRGTNAAPNDTIDQTLNRLRATGTMVQDTRNGITAPRIDLWRATQTVGQPAP